MKIFLFEHIDATIPRWLENDVIASQCKNPCRPSRQTAEVSSSYPEPDTTEGSSAAIKPNHMRIHTRAHGARQENSGARYSKYQLHSQILSQKPSYKSPMRLQYARRLLESLKMINM